MAPPGTKSYPSTAFVLSLIGGIFILLGALAEAALIAIFGTVVFVFIPGLGALILGLAAACVLFALIIIVGAVMLRARPQSAKLWGAIIIVLSIVSIFGALGGFFIGFILALIGGIMAVTWHPPPAPQAAWGTSPTPPMGSPPPTG
ncbi:MAG TPA: DUF6114 domain-containing protein [Thermoplasmata archaeon]|nr:DUF6114 domain-containing protein [Thermoplasmata archaeon]